MKQAIKNNFGSVYIMGLINTLPLLKLVVVDEIATLDCTYSDYFDVNTT